MFGSPWGDVIVTAGVLKTTINLCDEISVSTEDINDNFTYSSNIQSTGQNYDVAIFYDDPDVEGWRESCEYSQMTQTVERLYPSANYLLISNDKLNAIRKRKDEPDTNLSLASVILQDAYNMINEMFRNETGALMISGGAILLTIDAYSRAYVDTCNCQDDTADVKRKRLWTILLRVGSSLSITGSAYILFSLSGTRERRANNLPVLFNRLLISICCFDILSTITIFVGPWVVPSSPPGDFEKFYSQARWHIDYPDASGNTTTCTIQGVLVQFGVSGSTLFTAFLAIHTLLVVKYRWNDEKMRRVEIFFFGFGISFSLMTAVPML